MATKRMKSGRTKKKGMTKPTLRQLKRELERLDKMKAEIDLIQKNIRKYIEWNADEGQAVRQNMRIRNEGPNED